jgi:general secretion pathway protein F
MEAQDPGAVAARLREMNFFPVGIERASDTEDDRSLRGRNLFSRRSRAVLQFTHQLALLLGAGLPLDRCLAISTELTEDRQLARVAERIRRSVEEGSSLGDAMARHPKYFSDLYVNMVRAGEASGTLDRILARLTEFLEQLQHIREVVITALTYPLFLLSFAFAAVAVIFTVVVPKFSVVFADMGSQIPAPTRIIIAASEAFRAYWLVFAVCLAGAVIGVIWFFRTREGREWLDRAVLKIPLIGDLVVKVQVSRFARVLGTLVTGGVPILKALEIVTATLTNTVFSRSVANVGSGLKEGQGVAEPLRRAGVFPPLFLHMVTVGEETGRLEEMLLTVAGTYDQEVERGTKRLLSLMEPIIILFMGIVIGTIVISILYGIFSINQVAF